MPQLTIQVDNELCFDCKACEIACKQENDVPIGLRWIQVVRVGPKEVGENLVTRFSPVMCRHCAKAPCIEACPERAITKRADGIVLIDENLCIGCGECVTACPFGVIGINHEKQVAEKCTLCVHRVDEGLLPVCMQACPAGAIYFGDINDISSELCEERALRRRVT